MVRANGTTESLPDSVESLIAGDIDRLSPTDRTVLRCASVLGTTFDPALLAHAVRDEIHLDGDVYTRLKGLVDADDGGGMRFRNTLVRDAAYEGLPFRRRRVLHERVGDAIEALAGSSIQEEVSSLALHYFEARRDDKAWHYCRTAGDRAKAVAANVEAARFYRRALESARRLRKVPALDRAEVWKSLGTVCDVSGRFEEAYDALRQATGLLKGDPLRQAETYENRSRARVRQGEYGRALRETSAGLRILDGIPSAEAMMGRARLRAQRAELRLLQGYPREAVELALQAVEEGELTNELEALARAYTALDGAYQMLGQPDKAVHEQRAVEIWAELGSLRSVGNVELNLGVQAYSDGRWDEAADWYGRAQRDCSAAGDRQNAAIAGANLGELLVSRERFDEAEAVLVDARRVLRGAGLVPFALFAETQLARAAVKQGRAAEGLEALERILVEAEDIGHAGISLEIAIYFGYAAAAAGDPVRGLGVLEEAAQAAGEDAAFLAVPIDRVRGMTLVALDRLDEAAECFARALASARQQQLLFEQLLILRHQTVLARRLGTEPSAEGLDEATRLARTLGLEL